MIVMTIALLAVTQGAAQGQDFRWSGTLAAGKTIEVRDVNGSITATPASGNTIEVTAQKRAGRGGRPELVEIRAEERDDRVVICTVYPSQRDSEGCRGGGERRGRNNDDVDNVSVHFTVRVPSNIRFEGKTVNGDVTATGLAADAEVATVNGDVEVSTRGVAEASSVNGNVSATLGRSDWTGPVEFSSVNGTVTVTLPSNASAEVRASTVNGGIESDFPLTITGKFGPRNMNGTIGSGGPRLSLSSVNGSIALKRGS
jgi:hypothetical protein